MHTSPLQPLHHAMFSALLFGALLAVVGVLGTSFLFHDTLGDRPETQLAQRDMQAARQQQAMRAMRTKKAQIEKHKQERAANAYAAASRPSLEAPRPYAPISKPAPFKDSKTVPTTKPILASAVLPTVEPIPVDVQRGLAKVAIIIDDMGHSPKHVDSALTLPQNVAFALLPYARSTRLLAQRARSRGHELIVHMPMQPKSDTTNPGPHVLKVGASETDLRKAIAWNLDQFEGFYAVNNHMGSAFTEDAASMTILFEELSKRGLAFYDSRTTASSKSVGLAQRFDVSMAERDVFLDNELDASAVDEQLEWLEVLAQRNGSAIAIGHPHQVTFKRITDWSKTLADKGLVLVPPSEVMADRKTPYWRNIIRTAGREAFEAQSY